MKRRPVKLRNLDDLKFEKQRVRYDCKVHEKLMLSSFNLARETFTDSLRTTLEITSRKILYNVLLKLMTRK